MSAINHLNIYHVKIIYSQYIFYYPFFTTNNGTKKNSRKLFTTVSMKSFRTNVIFEKKPCEENNDKYLLHAILSKFAKSVKILC